MKEMFLIYEILVNAVLTRTKNKIVFRQVLFKSGAELPDSRFS